jgi:hypothetical protein
LLNYRRCFKIAEIIILFLLRNGSDNWLLKVAKSITIGYLLWWIYIFEIPEPTVIIHTFKVPESGVLLYLRL